MANKVKFNLKNVHYAKVEENGYGTPVAIPGAVSLSLDPQGELAKFFADGTLYFNSASNNGYEGDLEIALIPDQFRIDILNEQEDTNKVLFENADAITNKFAFGFQIDGDAKGTKYWFLNCTATRPGVNAQTKQETIEPTTDTLTLSCAPDANGDVRCKTQETTEATIYDNWFKQVYTKSAS